MHRVLLVCLVVGLVGCGKSDRSQKPGANPKTDDQEPVALIAPELTALGGIANITLEWKAVKGAAKYELKRADTSGGTYQVLHTAADLTFVDQSLAPGSTFYYKVRAKNAERDGPESVVASAKVLYPYAAAPATVAAVAGDTIVNLYWAAAARAVKYQIMRARAGVTTSVGVATATHFTDTGPMNGRLYTYFVQSLNEDNAPSPSTTVTAYPYAYGRQLCVSSSLADEIHVFAADATGTGVPLRTLQGPTSITNPIDVALDPANGTLLVLDGSTNDVVTFAVPGGVELRRLRGAWTSPSAITVDASRGKLWVADTANKWLYAYPVTDAGAGSTPVTIATGQTGVLDLEIDPNHGEIFSASPTLVYAWSVTSSAYLRRYPNTGNFIGLRAIAYVWKYDFLVAGEVQSPTYSRFGTLTRCNGSNCSQGGALYAPIARSGARIFNFVSMGYDSSRDQVFALADAYKGGFVPPTAYAFNAKNLTFTETLLTAPAHVTAVAIDPVSQKYWLAGDHYLYAYDLSLTNLYPIGAVGSTTGLSVPQRLVSDPVNQELYVYNAGTHGITTFPWSAAGAAVPTRTVTAANGPDFSGELLYVAPQNQLYARAGTNVVAGFPRTTNGTVDLTSVDTTLERPWRIDALAYDAVGNRIVAHAQTADWVFGFYFWNPTLGTALGYGNEPYSMSSPIQSMVYLNKLHLLTNLSSWHAYRINGLTVSGDGSYIPSGYTSQWTTLLHDERNNQLLIGMGGRVYTFTDEPVNGLVMPERELNITTTVGNDVSGMAFCTP